MGWSSCYAGLWASFLEEKTQRRKKEQVRYEKQVLHLMLTLRCKFTTGTTLRSGEKCASIWLFGTCFKWTARLRMASTLLQMLPLYAEMWEKGKKTPQK